MRSKFSFIAFLLLVVLALSVSFVQSGGCLNVSLSADKETACPGDVVTVTAQVTNNGDSATRVDLTLTGPGAQEKRVSAKVMGGSTVPVKLQFVIPKGIPPGSYTLEVDATSKNGCTDREFFTITIAC
ncbi:MAG: hypothetical protein DMF49_07050 [Acidobacteria bacterium]|nr:MAG: hypothetical protein DMF49_07050 [Acidobacteriota bacterium]